MSNKSSREWQKKNPTRMKEISKNYYLRNKDKVLARSKEWKNNNPDKVKQIQLKYNFGISIGEYNNLFSLQNGTCAICKRAQGEFKLAFAVDHCHKTNEIRGLLCTSCNTRLGFFETYKMEILNYLEGIR